MNGNVFAVAKEKQKEWQRTRKAWDKLKNGDYRERESYWHEVAMSYFSWVRQHVAGVR